MDPAYVAAIFGLLGAIVGSLGSALTLSLQAKIRDRREKMLQVTSLAIEHFKASIEVGHKSGRPYNLLPPSIYAIYYLELIDLMEKGDLNERAFLELSDKNHRLVEALKKSGNF